MLFIIMKSYMLIISRFAMIMVFGLKYSRIPSTDSPPPYLDGAAAAYDKANNQLIVYGGSNVETAEYSSEIYTFSLDSLYWSELYPESDYIPPGLSNSYMVIYDSNVYIFYGKKSGGFNGDIYSFSLYTYTWKLEYLLGDKIQCRLDCAFTTFENGNTLYLAIFGGLGHLGVGNELFL